MDLSFYIYIFTAIVAILGGSFFFFKSNTAIAGSIYLLGSLVIIIFFGARWFLPSGVAASTPSTWPPVINVCPDFLSLVTLTPTQGGNPTTVVNGVVTPTTTAAPEQVCVDTIGITNGGMSKWTPGTTDEGAIFHLYASTGDAKTRLAQLVKQCAAKGVTWEGVYSPDGTAGSTAPPLPPTAVVPTVVPAVKV